MTEQSVGRPSVITPEVIDKLEAAFLKGQTDLDACFIAGIGKTAYYDHRLKDPKFAERVDGLKRSVTIRAKMNIADKIDEGDIGLSRWHLERTDPEYNPKNTTDINLGGQEGNPLKVTVVTPD